MDYIPSITSANSTVLAVSSISCFIIVALHYYYKNAFKYWTDKGIKNPKPLPVLGNILPLLSRDRAKTDRDWAREYGKVYGVYLGRKPRLVIADPEVLNQVCIKNFDSFQNHDVQEFSIKTQKLFLIALQGEHWKRVRALMTPTFTSGKIKRMLKFLDGCAEDLVECFSEHLSTGGFVDVKETYSLYTMDAITTCCYGLKLERAGSTNLKVAATRNDFVRMGMRLFEFNYFLILVSLTIPKPILRLINFKTTEGSKFNPMAKTVGQLVEKRKEASRGTKKKFDDYLQLLLDAELNDEMELNEMDSKENHHAGLTKESLLEDQQRMVEQVSADQKGGKFFKLTDEEIIANAMFLLIVGLETTGTLLSNTTYILAFHQEIQQRLYEELFKIVELSEDKKRYSFDYDSLTSCKYLDAVLSESLRLLSPVIALDRVADEDFYIEKYNLHVPKGMVMNLAFHAIMNDPDYWPEPELFDPERFMPGNKEKIKPGTYCPFGIGPRHCIGMRFSLTEAKLALAKVMMNYKFTPAPNTGFPPEARSNFMLNGLRKPLVKITPRRTDM